MSYSEFLFKIRQNQQLEIVSSIISSALMVVFFYFTTMPLFRLFRGRSPGNVFILSDIGFPFLINFFVDVFTFNGVFLSRGKLTKGMKRPSVFTKISELRSQEWQVPFYKFILLLAFYTLYALQLLNVQLFNLQNWIYGAGAEISLILLMSFMLIQSTEEENAPMDQSSFTVAIIAVYIVKLIVVFGLYVVVLNTKIGSISQLSFLLTTIPLIVGLVLFGIVLLQQESVKMKAFTGYRNQFKDLQETRKSSFTGFVAKIPERLANMKFFLNILFASLIGLTFPIYFIFWMVVSGGYPMIDIIEVVVLAIGIAIIFVLVSQTRDNLLLIMQDYSEMMNSFEERNKEFIRILDRDSVSEMGE